MPKLASGRAVMTAETYLVAIGGTILERLLLEAQYLLLVGPQQRLKNLVGCNRLHKKLITERCMQATYSVGLGQNWFLVL